MAGICRAFHPDARIAAQFSSVSGGMPLSAGSMAGEEGGVEAAFPAFTPLPGISSYSSRASLAGPRRVASESTRSTRTVCRCGWSPNGTTSTSPIRSLACGLSVGCPFSRINPCSINLAHRERLFRKRAHHNQLSSRCQFWGLPELWGERLGKAGLPLIDPVIV
ncbi:Hypothetical protein GbCGDNIH9_8006 [Granulibacter bethesdensis]|uniref:Uncharacterized protein n=1 Tax=Granulibacter bethesdensis TaxID=364410 RepID=A0AAC9KB75_9PROT|nr:Hypothetical protein GbCGDNIH9_8006 [Granulibacter bethesdensis]APH61120.1 Hypothetical protein GbCGDNIH8_8404 [Granulibacter bethesdensis]